MKRVAFYDSLRPHVNLTTQNVFGMEKVLDYGEARGTPLNEMAYILATAWWETGQTMTPVIEAYWLSEAWRKANLRYYPWHGRGLIQTTWRENYVKMSPHVGTELTKNPDALLEWRYSLPALFVGMEQGLYTGHDLDDHIDELDESDAEDLREYTAARRIVNGTDKAATIGQLALRFEHALKAAGYAAGDVTGGQMPEPAPTQPPDVEPPSDAIPERPAAPPADLVLVVLAVIAVLVIIAIAALL